MAKVIVDISQLVRWNKLLATESVAIANRVQVAVGKQALDVRSNAEADAPVDTGALRASIRSAGGGLRRRISAGSGRARYAVYQEFGTRKMAASPFLITQANQQTLGEFETRVATATFAGALMRGGI